MRITLDTNIILAFAGQEKDKNQKALEKLFYEVRKGGIEAFISTVTLSEIFACLCREGEAKKAAEIAVFLKEIGVRTVEVNENIAKRAGVFKAKYSLAKKGFSYGDAIILATALETASDYLLTYDNEFAPVREIPIKRPEDLPE